MMCGRGFVQLLLLENEMNSYFPNIENAVTIYYWKTEYLCYVMPIMLLYVFIIFLIYTIRINQANSKLKKSIANPSSYYDLI